MLERGRSRRGYANATSTLALVIAIATGGAYAASKIGPEDIKKNAVRAKHIKKKQVKAKHVKPGAVRTKHIRDGAVSAAKLANGLPGGPASPTGPAGGDLAGSYPNPAIADDAITGEKLSPDVPGLALAGADIHSDSSDTTIFSWFNRFGGAPTVDRTGTGVYEVEFPGLETSAGLDGVVSITPTAAVARLATQGSCGVGCVQVRTFNSSGAALDVEFNLAIMAHIAAGQL